MRRQWKVSAAVLAVLLAVGCGGGGGDSTGPNSGPLTATINGASWVAAQQTVRAERNHSNPADIIAFAGTSSGAVGLGIAFPDSGAKTYQLGGLHPSNALISQGALVWVANVTGGSGTLTVTEINATHVAGTFSFDAVASGGGGGGTKHVTNGHFDIPF